MPVTLKPMSASFFDHLVTIFFGGSAFALFALAPGYFLERDRCGRLAGFSLYAVTGVLTLFMLAENLRLYESYPLLLHLNDPLEFFLAPVIYWSLVTRFERRIGLDPVLLALFIVPFVALAAMLPFYLQPAALKLQNPMFENFAPLARVLYFIIVRGSTPLILLAMVIFLRRIYTILGEKSFDYLKKIKYFKLYVTFWSLLILLAYLLYLWGQLDLYKLVWVFLNTALVTAFYLEGRSFLFFDLIRRDTSEAKYRRSLLKGVDTPHTIARIRELIETDELYRDEQIRLDRLAAMLGISVHQLSEIFNVGMGMNFKSYLNSCRIEAARRMLIESEKESILAIALQCGYNSKSVFNTTFMKLVGMTPSEFRQKNEPNRAKNGTVL